MALRNYQKESLNAVASAVQRGVRHGLTVLPTGAGKTVVLSHLPSSMGMAPGEQMLVLVHRDELVNQTVEKLQRYNPDLHVTIDKAENKADVNADLIVASVQTIGRNPLADHKFTFKDRIARLDAQRIQYVVVDEAHHATATSYRGVLAYLGVLKGSPYDWGRDKFLLGVTATPNRGDNQGLSTIFSEIVYSKSLPEMIDESWLVDIKAYRVDTRVDISEVKTSAGDFQTKALEKTVNTPSRNALIVDKYLEFGEGQRGVVFTVDVQHSEDVATAFNNRGIRALAISGQMPMNDRRKALQLFRDGYYRILASCGVLSEGWDDPAAVVALMARPTKSGLLFRQQVGRVLRPFPAPEELTAMRSEGREPAWIKPYAIVIDFCDLSGKHILHTAPSLFGLNPKMDLNGKKGRETTQAIEKVIQQKKLPLALDSVESLEKLDSIVQQVDLLRPATIPEHVRKVSRFAWIEYGADSYSLSVPDYGIVRVKPNMLNQWEVSKTNNGIMNMIGTTATLEEAVALADRQVPESASAVMDQSSKWREKRTSEAQIKYMWRLDHRGRRQFKDFSIYCAAVMRQYPHMGDASNRINQLLGRN
jgi:superfamily II DNA or RNA helicase